MTVVEEVTRVLEALPNVRLAVLFGSTARGTARNDSDLDIGVSVSSDDDITPDVQVALERIARTDVNLIRLDEAPPLLRFQIARDGVVLVERHPKAWAQFRARAMIDWWDWAPTVRMMHRTMAQRLREEADRAPA